jgi:hypothetical protein
MHVARRAVVAVFDDPRVAEQAIDALQEAGFSLQRISISSHYSQEEAEETKQAKATQKHIPGRERLEGVIANLKRLFTGERTETDNEPPDVKSGLEGMGLAPEEAEYYEEQYRRGRTVIGVRAEDRVADATNILRAHGGQDFGASPDAKESLSERVTGKVTGSYSGNSAMNRPPYEQKTGSEQQPATEQPEPEQPINPSPEPERERPGRFERIPDYAHTSEQSRKTEGGVGSAPIEEPHKLNSIDEERARQQRERRDEP